MTYDLARREADFRKFIRFKDARFHPIITNRMATVAARRIDGYYSIHFAGHGIEPDQAVLQFEGSVRVMGPAVQRIGNHGFRGIQFECGDFPLRNEVGGDRAQGYQYCQRQQ